MENIHTITKELDTKVKKITETTNVIESNTKSYREALIATPVGMNVQAANPIMMSDFEWKERQILLSYTSSNNNATLQTCNRLSGVVIGWTDVSSGTGHC